MFTAAGGREFGMVEGRDNVLDVVLGDAPGDEVRLEEPGFDGFFREHYRGLVQYLRKRTDTPEDAEDAAQESLTRFLRYRQSKSTATWKALLYRIATNIAHDRARLAVTHRADKHVPLEAHEVVAQARTPEEQAVHEEQVRRLSAAIVQLPPKCRRVYLLKRVHGLSRAQIAERCGISVKMVEKHLANALVHLRRQVGDGDLDT